MAEDSGGLGGLLGWFGRPYDPQAAYEGLLSSQPTKDALRARSLASIAQAFGAGAGSDARGSAIPFGTTMGNAAAAAYSGQDALIAARNVAAEQQLHQAQAGVQRGILSLQPIELEMYRRFAAQQDKEAGAQKAGLSPKDIIAGGGGETYWTPQGLAALRPTEGAYDQIHYPSGSPSTASGAYGFLDSTWQQQAPKAGVDIEKYPRAYLAPPELQDKVAAITPIGHWTGTDAKGNPYNFRAQRLATNPAFVTGGAAPAEPRQAGGGGREPTAAETAIYAQTPGTVQNAARRAPTDSAFWNTAQPTGTLGAAPSGAPLGPAVAPPTPPGGTPATSPAAARGLLDLPEVPSYSGALGGTPAAPSLPGQGATLIPRAAPGGQLGGLLDTQPDPVTARTMAALKSTAGAAPGVNATDTGAGVGGLLNQGAVAAAAPPADPRLAALARVAGPGAAEPGGLLGGGSLQRTIDQTAGATVPPITQGGGLLPQAPVPPQAPPPAASPVAPPAAVPPAAAPAMPPGGIPLPALPPMPTLPAPPQMRDVPVPPMPAPTTLEGMAQAIAGISSLTGHPAPAFMQDLAKMPAARQQELYKAYLLNETNAMNEKYKAQIQLTTSQYVKAAEEAGAAPYKIQQELLKNKLWFNPANSRYEMLPGALEAMAIEKQQTADIETKKQFDIEAAKGGITQALAQRTGALDAVRSLENSTEARKLLDQGIITGKGANTLLEFGKALQVIGFHQKDDPIANTEAYAALRAGEVGRMIKQFGSGTGLSDADREYASKMAAGNITANEQSIRKIIDISDRASNRLIDDYNKEAARLGSRFIPPVEKPDLSAQTTGGGTTPGNTRVMHDPQSGWEIVAPPGSKQWMWSNGPNAGKPYVPPGGR